MTEQDRRHLEIIVGLASRRIAKPDRVRMFERNPSVSDPVIRVVCRAIADAIVRSFEVVRKEARPPPRDRYLPAHVRGAKGLEPDTEPAHDDRDDELPPAPTRHP